jgi:hypothetical protein
MCVEKPHFALSPDVSLLVYSTRGENRISCFDRAMRDMPIGFTDVCHDKKRGKHLARLEKRPQYTSKAVAQFNVSGVEQ